MVAAIAESKDLLTYSFDKLRCSVLAHEVRINKEEEKVEDNAFQVRGKQMSGLLITEVMVKVKMVLVIVVVQVFTRGRGGRGRGHAEQLVHPRVVARRRGPRLRPGARRRRALDDGRRRRRQRPLGRGDP